MNTTRPIPATQNDAWGFWGTMNEKAAAAWPLAITTSPHPTAQPPESVSTFVDTRHARHFADDVQNSLYRGQALAHAINTATQQWMAWTIGRQTSKDYGIPRGMPYLTGFVIHTQIVEDSLAA